MKTLWWIWATFLVSTVLSEPEPEPEPSAFLAPRNAETTKRAFEILQLLKRSDTCPGGYNSCSDLGHSEVCCRDGTNCSRDAADNVACCPTGASCTGSLTGTSAASDSFMFPHSASATPTTPGPPDATITGSTITGAPYPFVYIPTTFSDESTCSSYYTMCQNEYTKCTSSLGGGYGVTIGAPGEVGMTVVGNGGATPSAVSVCSSLSMDACHELSLGHCDSYNNWRSDASFAFPRRTSIQDLVFGLAVGVAGIFI